MRKILWAALFALSAQASAASIKLVGYINGGSGCPQGSVRVVMAPDGSSFTVLYDKLNLHVLPGQPSGVMECEVDISVNKPLLLGLKIMEADFRGFIGLTPGVRAEQQVQVAAGLVKQFRKVSADFGRQTWEGPVEGNFNLPSVHTANVTDILSCIPPNKKSHIIIKTRIRVLQNGNLSGEGLLAVDSTDGTFQQNFKIQWRDCIRDIGGLLGGLFGGR